MKYGASLEDLDWGENSYEKCTQAIKQFFGDELPAEKISRYVQSADGNLHVAMNQILNDLETQKSTNRPSPSPSSSLLGKVLSEVAEEVKCAICLSYFESPVELSCAHVFCLTCIEEMANDSNEVMCPLCRHPTDLKGRGVSGLKPNLHIANIVEKLKTTQVSQCGKCTVNAMFYCDSCDEFLCQKCDTSSHVNQKADHERVLAEQVFGKQARRKLNGSRGSENVVLQGEELAIPFEMTKDKCREAFQTWAQTLWFAPSDLGTRSRIREFKACYMPFWLFDLEVGNRLSILASKRGLSSPPVPYKMQIMVNGSEQHAELFRQMQPWKLDTLKPLSPKALDNVTLVPFAMSSEHAEKSEGFKSNLDPKCSEKTAQKSQPTPPESPLVAAAEIYTAIMRKTVKKVYVPVYVSSYDYRGTSYQILVNGVSGKCCAQRPYSHTKLFSVGLTTGMGALGFIAGTRSAATS
jgi:hypothetical protein